MATGGQLEGRVAIVTGAARGTGEAVARRFAAEGARVVVTDVREELGAKVAAELGDLVEFAALDVTQEDDWARVVGDVAERHGRIDVLVNNAAQLHMGPIAKTPPDVFRRIVDVNAVGPYLGIRAVVPAMQAAGAGSIVNVGSIDGLLGMNGLTAYTTSKWGLRGLTKAAALELGRSGIRVNCVCPAGGNPEMFGPWFGQISEFLEETVAYTNNRGIPGEASLETIASAVLYLASDASEHGTGIDLPVDEGAFAGHFIPGFNEL